MSAVKKDKPTATRKWDEGKKYKCIKSESPGYKTGSIYKAYKNGNGIVCLKGEDGYEDMCSMLVSAFTETP